jgi:Skp family chaperone for outer membrane proteins
MIISATSRTAAIPTVNGDVLSEVLAVEREIDAKLDAERQAARQWLERTRSEIEQAKMSELTALKASATREQEAAKMAAHNKAAAILQQAGTEAERIRRLEDARLIPIVRQHVLLIARGRAE